MQHAPRRIVAAVALVGLAATAVALVPTSAGAVDTDIAIDTSTVDFGSVDIGNTGGPISVTLTNTGGSPFGPINIFGGAPPSPAFNASQNCQGTTLPAGGSCTVNYTFSPTAAGPANDTSAFTISQTSSQSDGEDFSVTLMGVGVDTTTTTSSSTTTSSTSTTTSSTTTTTTTTATTTPTTSASTTPQATTAATAPPPATTTSTTTSTSTTVPRQPLTGIVIAPRPALVVKVDNVDAAPQSGLNQADIVFEEIVEGQATRFAAVFNSMDADPVGPIRSARTQDVNLLLSLNDPALAYSGANDGVNAALGSAGFELLTEGDPGFFRDDSRPAPHNLFANTSQLWSQLSSSGDAVPAFAYVAPGASVSGTPVSFVEMMVGDYNVRWDWDGTQRLFLRSQLGAPHMLTDGQASANTVVVLVVPYGVSAAGGGPEAQTIGTGTAFVYSDGVEVDGTWTRASATDPFTLEANGQPILIAPGRTWVELVDANNGLTDG